MRPLSEASLRWEAWARLTLEKGRCEACGQAQGRERLEGHHALSQQRIKRWASSVSLGPDELLVVLTDPRNHIALCKRHHARHESRLEPLPATILSSDAKAFADELGLTYVLDRLYSGSLAA